MNFKEKFWQPLPNVRPQGNLAAKVSVVACKILLCTCNFTLLSARVKFTTWKRRKRRDAPLLTFFIQGWDKIWNQKIIFKGKDIFFEFCQLHFMNNS